MSQEALAHECGINRTYLSGVERAERNISLDNISRITSDKVVATLANIAFADPAEAFDEDGVLKPWHEMPPDVRAAIAGIGESFGDKGTSRRLKFSDRIRALELLGRHLGMFNDRLTLKGAPENPLLTLIQHIQGNTVPVVTDAEIQARIKPPQDR